MNKGQWIFGAEFTAPAAATQITKITPTIAKIGLVYGYHYISQEASAAGKVGRLRMNINTVAVSVVTFDIAANQNPFVAEDALAALRGNGIDFFEVINVVAGVAATIHRCGLLYKEYDLSDLAYLAALQNLDLRKFPYRE